MRKKHLFIAAGVLLLLFLFGGYKYRTCYAKTEIVRYPSGEGRYELVIYEVGEPAFPFGPGRCRLDLHKDGKTACREEIVLYNDGKRPGEDNFSVTWKEDFVCVTARGEEQEDEEYILYFEKEKAAGQGE